jgi:hypothetical protein
MIHQPASPTFHHNYVLGTQAFGEPYQFTTRPYLLEVASELLAMGSNFIKFGLSSGFTADPTPPPAAPPITSLRALVAHHSVYRTLFDMPFKWYHCWTYEFTPANWRDGLSAEQEKAVYRELFELCDYLITRYNGTGKQFYLGHWEGDWTLLGSVSDPQKIPTSREIERFARWLAIRQQAVTDARRKHPLSDVGVYHYTEVNLVTKAMNGLPTVSNRVLPLIDIDYVSYSCYDSILGSDVAVRLPQALDFIESQMRPAPHITGKRVFIGEFAIKAALVSYNSEQHDRRNRTVAAAALRWGCPFVVYWQMYCNERTETGQEGFWLIDDSGVKVPWYHTMHRLFDAAKHWFDTHPPDRDSPRSDGGYPEFAATFLTAD